MVLLLSNGLVAEYEHIAESLGMQAIEPEKEVVDGQDLNLTKTGLLRVAPQGVRTHHRARFRRWLVGHADREAV